MTGRLHSHSNNKQQTHRNSNIEWGRNTGELAKRLRRKSFLNPELRL